MAVKAIESNLEYHPHAALIVHMGSELSRWDKTDVNRNMIEYFCRPNYTLAMQAKEYLNGIYSNSNKYNSKIAHKNNKADSFLYQPASFVSFGGNTDNLSIIPIDDFDISVKLTTNLDIPIKQTNIAFCPTLDSIIPKRKQKYFCEISDICEEGKYKGEYGFPVHSFLKDKPLGVITYYRFSGLATLGSGLLFQESIMRTMAEIIFNTVDKLKTNELYNEKSKEVFRCLFLDTQGWADLATFMLCDNYSIIASVMMQLHRMTFDDICRQARKDDRKILIEAIKQNNIHSTIDHIYRMDIKKEKKHSKTKHILKRNHILYSSHSTACITHDAFFDESSESNLAYYGYVSNHLLFNFSPGHKWPNSDYEKQLKENTLSKKAVSLGDKSKILWVLFGSFDATENSIFSPKEIKAIPLKYLIERIKNLRGWEKKRILFDDDWPIHGLATDLFIPLPMDNCLDDIDNSNHIDLRLLLTKLRKHLFQNNTSDMNNKISLQVLKNSIKRLEIPAPLSSAIIYLFIDYAHSVSDPNLFDNVIDLHDMFLAFYRVLTSEIPRMQRERFRDIYQSESTLEDFARYSFMRKCS